MSRNGAGSDVVRVIDLGLDRSFAATTAFLEANVRALLEDLDDHEKPFELELIRTRSERAIEAAVRQPAYVLHLLGHGDAGWEEPGIWSTDGATGLSFTDLAKQLGKDHVGLDYSLILADGCETAKTPYVRALRGCTAAPTVFVGTKGAVGWHDGSTFGSMLYSALLHRAPTTTRAVLERANRAVGSYDALWGRCPYKVMLLEPL